MQQVESRRPRHYRPRSKPSRERRQAAERQKAEELIMEKIKQFGELTINDLVVKSGMDREAVRHRLRGLIATKAIKSDRINEEYTIYSCAHGR